MLRTNRVELRRRSVRGARLLARRRAAFARRRLDLRLERADERSVRLCLRVRRRARGVGGAAQRGGLVLDARSPASLLRPTS